MALSSAFATTNLTRTSGYSGEALDMIALRMSSENEWFDAGLIYIQEMVSDTLYLPRLQVNNIIQDRAAIPTSQGNMIYDEQSIPMEDAMVYLEFNPRNFEHIWRPFQPNGELLFRELPPEVQNALLTEVTNKVGEWMSFNIPQGDKAGAAPNNKFDGLLTKMLADATIVDVNAPVALTVANVKDAFRNTYKALPAKVQMAPNLKFICSHTTKLLLRDADQDQQFKGPNFPQAIGGDSVYGAPVVGLPSMRDNTIIATHCDSTINSNLKMGVDNTTSTVRNTFQVEKLQNNAELHFVKQLLKMNVGYTWGEEIALYYA